MNTENLWNVMNRTFGEFVDSIANLYERRAELDTRVRNQDITEKKKLELMIEIEAKVEQKANYLQKYYAEVKKRALAAMGEPFKLDYNKLNKDIIFMLQNVDYSKEEFEALCNDSKENYSMMKFLKKFARDNDLNLSSKHILEDGKAQNDELMAEVSRNIEHYEQAVANWRKPDLFERFERVTRLGEINPEIAELMHTHNFKVD